MLKRMWFLFLLVLLNVSLALCSTPQQATCFSFAKILDGRQEQVQITDPIFSSEQQAALQKYWELNQKNVELRVARRKHLLNQGPGLSDEEMKSFGLAFAQSAHEMMKAFSFPHRMEKRAHGYRLVLGPNSETELGTWMDKAADNSKLKVVWNSSYMMLAKLQGALYDPNSSTLSISPAALAQFANRGNGVHSLFSPSSKEFHEGVHRSTDLASKKGRPTFMSGDLYYPKDLDLAPYDKSTALDEITAHMTEVAIDLAPVIDFLKKHRNLKKPEDLSELRRILRDTPILDGRSKFKRLTLFESITRKLQSLYHESDFIKSSPKSVEKTIDDGWVYLTHPGSDLRLNVTHYTEHGHRLQLIQAEIATKQNPILLQWYRNNPSLLSQMRKSGSKAQLAEILLLDLERMKIFSARSTDTYKKTVELQRALRRFSRTGKNDKTSFRSLRKQILQNFQEIVDVSQLK